MYFNYGNVLFQLNQMDKAIEYYQKAGDLQRDMYQAFLNIGSYYLNLAQNSPVEEETSHLNQAMDYLEESQFRLELAATKFGRVAATDKSYSGAYRQIQAMVGKIKACLAHPRTLLQEKLEQAKSGEEKDLIALADFYLKRLDFLQALQTYEQLEEKKPNDYQLIMKKYNIARQFNPGLSIQILENALQRFNDLEGAAPNEQYQLAKQCGVFYLSHGERLITQPNADVSSIEQAYGAFNRANHYLSTYRAWGLEVMGQLKTQGQITRANQLKRDLIQIEKQLNHINQRIQLIENAQKQQQG